MKFICAERQEGVQAFVKRLTAALSGGHNVLWLYSGGSNIPLVVQIMRQIPAELTRHLTVIPIDERYGQDGHTDSNSRQLREAGFDPKEAQVLDVLTGASIEATTQRFDHTLAQAFTTHDIIIAQIGMGSDGHISGILPHSPAITAEGLATYYQGHDYLRVTTTFTALAHVTVGYLFAYGENKREQLEHLRDENPPLAVQPAQFLKSLPEAYVYNDQIKERES